MAMRRYPEEREMQFHACFNLINLSLRRDARNLIRDLNGIESTVIAAMRQFDDYALLQRCACNVLVSMAWGNRSNRQRMAKANAIELVRRAMERFSTFHEMF
jgi:hypothetical protein